jgi:hypothetical protein
MKKLTLIVFIFMFISCQYKDNSFVKEIANDQYCYLFVANQKQYIMIQNIFLKHFYEESYSIQYKNYLDFLEDVILQNKKIKFADDYISKYNSDKLNKKIIRDLTNKNIEYIIEKYLIKNDEDSYSLNELGLSNAFSIAYVMFQRKFIIYIDDYTGNYIFKKTD